MTPDEAGGREVVVCGSMAEIARRAAREWVESAEQARAEGRPMRVALSGGSTPRHLYRQLLTDPFRSRIDWSQIHFFWGDERCVPITDPRSNFGMAWQDLLSQVDVAKNQIHRIRGEADPEEAVRHYRECLRGAFELKEGEFPRFDLVLLGMGADGHTASLFPGTDCLEDQRYSVCAGFVDGVGAFRVTLTLPVINHARRIVFMMSGDNKANALARVLGSVAEDPLLPAARVQPSDGRLLFLVDETAASWWADGESGSA